MKTVLITGANRGLGLLHTQAFAAAGAKVFATARDPAAADALNAITGDVTVLPYDAATPGAARQLKEAVGDTPIDLLFANGADYGAGGQSFGGIDEEAFLRLMRINTLAPLKLAEAFVDQVAASTRRIIALQSSIMGSNAGSMSGGFYGYRASKAALNRIASTLAGELAGRGVIVVALHPGWARTRMGGPNADLAPEESVSGQQALLAKLTPSDAGKLLRYDGVVLPW
jgi:NAD(P)-dependent dehydrogenase (short-subunit alcohol dehydrogenase family)